MSSVGKVWLVVGSFGALRVAVSGVWLLCGAGCVVLGAIVYERCVASDSWVFCPAMFVY